MPRYLIETNHTSEHEGCVRALHAIVVHGSHLITQSEWGCEDGVHRSWLIAETDSREEAMLLVPPAHRASARVVKLRTWSRDEIEEMMRELES